MSVRSFRRSGWMDGQRPCDRARLDSRVGWRGSQRRGTSPAEVGDICSGTTSSGLDSPREGGQGSRREAPVDGEHGAGHERRRGRGEPDDGAGGLFGSSGTTERRGPHRRLALVLRPGRAPGGVEIARSPRRSRGPREGLLSARAHASARVPPRSSRRPHRRLAAPGSLPTSEVTRTIAPEPAGLIARSATRAKAKAPRTLTPVNESHSSRSVSSRANRFWSSRSAPAPAACRCGSSRSRRPARRCPRRLDPRPPRLRRSTQPPAAAARRCRRRGRRRRPSSAEAPCTREADGTRRPGRHARRAREAERVTRSARARPARHGHTAGAKAADPSAA